MGRTDGATKPIIIASILAIIMCFLPWWTMFIEADISGEITYLTLNFNPIYGAFTMLAALVSNATSFWSTLLGTGTLSLGTASDTLYLVAVIIVIVGGVIGIIGFGKKKITIVAGIVVIAGALLFILFLYMGLQITGINMDFFTNNDLNPIWGTYNPGSNFDYSFGMSFGAIGALITGIAILILSAKADD